MGSTKAAVLPVPGLGRGEDVAALEHERDGRGLDGGRGLVALLGDHAHEVGRQAECIEGQSALLKSVPAAGTVRSATAARGRASMDADRQRAAPSIAEIASIGPWLPEERPRST